MTAAVQTTLCIINHEACKCSEIMLQMISGILCLVHMYKNVTH